MLRHRLSKGDPEPIAVRKNKLTHAVKRVVQISPPDLSDGQTFTSSQKTHTSREQQFLFAEC